MSDAQLVPVRIAAHALTRADHPAVVSGDRVLTYGGLRQRSGLLSATLRAADAGPGDIVGLCTTRSVDAIAGMLAIFDVGAAYVPLDPSYPSERRGIVLDDARVSVILTERSLLPLFDRPGTRAICADDDGAAPATPGCERPVTITPDMLAYVMYTSGSTGRPKGVMITHGSLAEFARLACSALDVTPDDVYLQTASLAYALSVRQIAQALTTGATLVLADHEQMRDPIALFELVRRRGVTLMDVVPSFWRTCIYRLAGLPEDERARLLDNRLRRIVSVGEPLRADVPHNWRHVLRHPAELVNIFGQTETTGVVAAFVIPHDVTSGTEVVPIGRAIDGTRLYIVDSSLAPVPTGASGELCVSSPCMARGYLGQPELSAAKFVANPFGDGHGDRLYRTGDLARQRMDGNIELIGRADHQVKIRGQRLELGDVEAAILAHDGVRDCAVVVRGDTPDQRQLVAYVVADRAGLSADTLREGLKARLPDFMVPAQVAFLEALPLTPNGKVDRLNLPDPVPRHEPARLRMMVRPRSRTEEVITAIWRDLLRVEHVDVHDDYFALGGDSLMSVVMFARIEAEMGIRLPLTTLFHATTVAGLAAAIDSADDAVVRSRVLIPIKTSGASPCLFGIHGVEGGVLFWRHLVASLPPGQPFFALQAVGVDGRVAPLNRIPAMAATYIDEIRKVQPHGPYFLCGYSMGGEVAFEMAQQLVTSGERVDLVVLIDTYNPNRARLPLNHVSLGGTGSGAGVGDTTKVGMWLAKARGHRRRLAAIPPTERARYVARQLDARLRTSMVFALAGLYRRLGVRLPDRLLHRSLKARHGQAVANYVPVIYPGHVTLIRGTSPTSTPDRPGMGWAALAAGGLDIHHIDAPHEMMTAQHAPALAATLMDCLARARKTPAAA